MFESTVLEVASGLVFTFLAVSLATGAIVEAVSSVLKWRAQTLLAGVQQLVNDSDFTGLAKTLYQHALINPRGPGAADPKKNMPAYVDPKQFANALMDIIGITEVPAQPNAPTAGRPTAAALQTAVNTAIPPHDNPQMNSLLTGIIQRSHGDLETVRRELSDWFDNAMDRVSGDYKRWAQLMNFLIALVVCGALNIDAVRIATTLWSQPALVHAAKITGKPIDAATALQVLTEDFPIGWQGSPLTVSDPAVLGLAIVGWLITALATLFGAPFWFDALQSVIRLKGTGPSPEEKRTGGAAAA